MYKFHKDGTEPTNAAAVFVFGSNLAARHGGGAAKLAEDKYGASRKVAEGMAGNSYAIPTKDKKIVTLPLDNIREAVARFLEHATANPSVEFFMTRIGCVLAGYSNAEIAPMFLGAPSNIDFPEDWKVFIGEDEEVVTSYKGFDDDLKCRGFQYAVGETAVHNGDVKACAGGLHACEYPLDVLQYYAPNTSRFAVVEQRGNLSRHGDDTKVASKTLTVKAEIGIAGLIKAAVEYTIKRCAPVDPESPASATGYRGAASATGESGAASATGYRGAASATGESGAASATGTRGAASATGYRGAASATGESGAASATGYSGAASATGTRGAASATGYRGAASATGESGAASATGESGAASATGYSGAASATGTRGAASATGYRGAASATGYSGAASATGEKSVAMAVGRYGRAMAVEGGAIFLIYRDIDWNIVHARASKVGENGIKAKVWYSLDENGAFEEVD